MKTIALKSKFLCFLCSLLASLLVFTCTIQAKPTMVTDSDAAQLTFTDPYLLTLSPSTEMNICWLTPSHADATVIYSTLPIPTTSQDAVEYEIKGMRTSKSIDGYDEIPENNPELKVYQQIATLKNLKPNTTYYYQVTTSVGKQKETSPIYHFKTAPANGEDFNFILLSDLQLKAESPATVKESGKSKPDFIIYGGDLQNTPWKAGEWFNLKNCYISENEKGKGWFEIMQQTEDGCQLLQYAPIFITPGNHEIDDQRVYKDKTMATNLDNWSLSIYMQLFRPLYPDQEYGAGGKHWYSVDYGDLHIAAISAFRWQAWDGLEAPGWIMFEDLSANSKQIQWLEQDLKNTAAKYKWINMHWHMLNRGTDTQYPLSNPQVDPKNSTKAIYPNGDYAFDVLKPLYEKYHVNAVSFGHSHVYERYVINGINYIEAATIGNNYRLDSDPLHPSGIAPIFEENSFRSYMTITKDKNGLTAKGIQCSLPESGQGSIGRIFDGFTIAPNTSN